MKTNMMIHQSIGDQLNEWRSKSKQNDLKYEPFTENCDNYRGGLIADDGHNVVLLGSATQYFQCKPYTIDDLSHFVPCLEMKRLLIRTLDSANSR